MAPGSGFGVGLFQRVASMRRIRQMFEMMYSKYLLVTNVTTGFALAGAGDFINQRYETVRNMRTNHNWQRTRNQCVQVLLSLNEQLYSSY